MSQRGEGKGSCLIWIVVSAIGIFLLLQIGKHLTESQKEGPAAELQTPASAAKYYIRNVERVKRLNPENIGIQDLLGAVTKDDRKWYYDNQEKIYDVRRSGFDKMIGLASQQTIAKSVYSMLEIIEYSPNREDALIAQETFSGDGNSAVLDIEQGTAYGGTIHYRMELQKEGKLWKVKGFCGARAQLEREIAEWEAKKS